MDGREREGGREGRGSTEMFNDLYKYTCTCMSSCFCPHSLLSLTTSLSLSHLSRRQGDYCPVVWGSGCM